MDKLLKVGWIVFGVYAMAVVINAGYEWLTTGHLSPLSLVFFASLGLGLIGWWVLDIPLVTTRGMRARVGFAIGLLLAMVGYFVVFVLLHRLKP